jgi:hypothetical protein
MLMQNLYKRLAQIDTSFLNDDAIDNAYIGDYSSNHQMESNSVDMPATAIRDSEKIEHSSSAGSHGPIHMSGGSGEAKQHLRPDGSIDNNKNGVAAIKSDESLPFYCHPANPCPKDANDTEDCQSYIEDTAEAQKKWITNMQVRGACTCDREHMFNCPDIPATLESAMNERRQFNDQLDNLNGEKMESLVAKKSPRVKRSIGINGALGQDLTNLSSKKEKNNPYLAGERLRTVAKKG